jgi:CheY-like chemotaxis protein
MKSMSDHGSIDPMGAGNQPKVVFFVDDEDQVRLATARILEKRGYGVILAASAAEASEVIETHDGKIDVLLMDIHLPDGWGATVAVRLLQARPEMALVFTTGLAADDPVLSGGLNAAEFVVTKPFTADQLVAEIERAIAANS